MSEIRKVAVVTGASAGLGKAAAVALARQGWKVIAVGRNPTRAQAAEAEIKAASPEGDAVMLVADLAMMAEVERLVAEIAALTPRVDLLANNAGGMCDQQVFTSEGLEANFAGNHLGPFLLTQRLTPLLKAAAQGRPSGSVRVVNTSSDGSEMIPGINLDDLQNLANWSPGAAYCTGKLANVLHAKGLATRLAADGIVAHAFHPGTVASNFFTHVPEDTRKWTDTLEKITEEDGADTLLWLATSEEAGQCSGGYWHKRAPREANPVAGDPAVVERLWVESEKLVEGVKV